MSRPCRYAASAKSSWVRYRSPPSHRAPCCVRSMQRHVTRCAATPRGIFLTGTASRSTTARRRRASPSTKSERCTSPHDGAGPRRKAACSASRRLPMVCAANQLCAPPIARALPFAGLQRPAVRPSEGRGHRVVAVRLSRGAAQALPREQRTRSAHSRRWPMPFKAPGVAVKGLDWACALGRKEVRSRYHRIVAATPYRFEYSLPLCVLPIILCTPGGYKPRPLPAGGSPGHFESCAGPSARAAHYCAGPDGL